MTISVLIPTRGRPDGLQRAVDSLRDTATNPDKIEIHARYDSDDLASWKKRPQDILAIRGKPLGYQGGIYCNEMAAQATGTWLFPFNDDAWMVAQGWDEIIESHDPDLLQVLSFAHNDPVPGAQWPCVPRQWFELCGHLSLDARWDTWLQSVANMVGGGCLVVEPRVVIFHDRHDLTGSPRDKTYDDRYADPGFWDSFDSPANQAARVRDAAAIRAARGEPAIIPGSRPIATERMVWRRDGTLAFPVGYPYPNEELPNLMTETLYIQEERAKQAVVRQAEQDRWKHLRPTPTGIGPSTWDILIVSIEHRHKKLKRLLDAIAAQLVPGVNVIVYRDNLEAPIGVKRQRLLEASEADYVSFIDDDDLVAPDFVARVTKALKERPDYVGWEETLHIHYPPDPIHYPQGHMVAQKPVYHSLKHRTWHDDANGFYRGVTHHNPIRRELALLARFDTARDRDVPGEDVDWATTVQATGRVQTEVFIDAPMYLIHNEETTDCFWTVREPLTEHPPLLHYPDVRYIK